MTRQTPSPRVVSAKPPESYADLLDKDALKGKRIGIMRTPMGHRTEPDSEDFAKITALFDRAVGELADAGAVIVDPVEIAGMNELLDSALETIPRKTSPLRIMQPVAPIHRSRRVPKSWPHRCFRKPLMAFARAGKTRIPARNSANIYMPAIC